jgi:hypothetical protein
VKLHRDTYSLLFVKGHRDLACPLSLFAMILLAALIAILLAVVNPIR